jgi:hypothetical protein
MAAVQPEHWLRALITNNNNNVNTVFTVNVGTFQYLHQEQIKLTPTNRTIFHIVQNQYDKERKKSNGEEHKNKYKNNSSIQKH